MDESVETRLTYAESFNASRGTVPSVVSHSPGVFTLCGIPMGSILAVGKAAPDYPQIDAKVLIVDKSSVRSEQKQMILDDWWCVAGLSAFCRGPASHRRKPDHSVLIRACK